MAFITEDRVQETSTTTGTGSYTLAGAVTGFRAFSAVCSTNDIFSYTIEGVDANGVPSGEWETGIGTYSGANTLARTTVMESSNAGAAVNFSAGTKRCFISSLGQFGQPRLIGAQATTSGTSVSFTDIPPYYDHVFAQVVGVSHDSGSNQTLRLELSPDTGGSPSTWSSPFSISGSSGAAATWYGGVFIPVYPSLGVLIGVTACPALSGDNSVAVGGIQPFGIRMSGGIHAMRFSPSGGANFDAGAINLYGI
jgi:hypothetical protein